MDKEMKESVVTIANELRLAGSAIAELSHLVDKLYCESIGEAVNAEAVTDELRERTNRLASVMDDLRAVEARLLSNSLEMASIAEMGSEKHNA